MRSGLYVAIRQMRRRPLGLLIFAAVISLQLIVLAADADSAEDVSVPAGFAATLFADDELAHDVFSMTINADGNVVVAGSGYVKTLIDSDGDGQADTATTFADGPKSGSQGMFFLGSDLLCTGDGSLLRYRDANRDGQADGPPDRFLEFKTGGEHDVHSVQRGPDGWWYLNAGNYAGITSKYATEPTSPIKQPQAGVVFRLKPDLTGGEIVANGFRNPYDFAFHSLGDIFVFDSDGERDVSLPWYRPTRVFQAVPGSHAGWVSRSWKQPDYFVDMPPVVAEFGRGSPTGVVSYRHRQFPEKYRDSLFVLDWTYGRVLNVQLTRDGAAFSATSETFMTGVGQFGFAPTDAAVGPDGSLYISIGGRGTRGGVYRIRHVSSASESSPTPVWPGETKTLDDQVAACLDAPQPLSSWSRAIWEPLSKTAGLDAFSRAATNPSRATVQRVRAIEILVEIFGGVSDRTLEQLVADSSVEVRARAAWAIGRTKSPSEIAELSVPLVADDDPFVGRIACEALLGLPGELNGAPLAAALAKRLGSATRFDRIAAARLIPQLSKETFRTLAVQAAKSGWTAGISNAFGFLGRKPGYNSYAFEIALRVLDRDLPGELKLEAVRLMQLGLGDLTPDENVAAVFDGYAPALDLSAFDRELDPYRIRLAELFPTDDERLDYELARLLAMLQPFNAALLTRVLAKITDESHPTDDVHYLIVAARNVASRDSAHRTAVARALVMLEPKIKARNLNIDTNWGERLKELYKTLVELDPLLPDVVIEQPEFGRPDHVLFMSELPGELLAAAIEGFSRQIAADSDYPWTNDVLFVFGESEKPAHRQLVRDQFPNFSVRNAVLMVLASEPEELERSKFVEGLETPQVEVLEACLAALAKLSASSKGVENVALVRCLRRLGTEKNEATARRMVVEVLRRNSNREFGFAMNAPFTEPQSGAINAWTKWAIGAFPDEATALTSNADSNSAAVRELLLQTNWSTGNAARGLKIFNARSCIQCHGSGQALGPDLAGAAKRFSRDDLFTAIVNPDRDVSSRYQTTMLVTSNGKVYTGLLIYEAVDGVILRNATNQTFRIEMSDVDVQRKLPQSLMPPGLLKGATSQDLADLYAYLQSLGRNKD
ncbi:MAG: HEAT repeat domain-containing protein [Planctomycetota bacterium]|nr:HEAT repeat domain-containing protein [Planctomycetota bacterium]